MRVRRLGKSYAHPLVVLVALPNEQNNVHFAISSGRSVGSAVQRNRAKRLLREALRPLIPNIPPGWDILLLSRRPLAEASYQDTQEALIIVLKRAHLLIESYGNRSLSGT
jgi:ribonuclease P protein component